MVGKNYDWSIENGLVIVNKGGVQKTAAQYRVGEFGKPVEWKSRFGSITFNQFGRELPMGGINEAGLVVEVLMLTDTVYPEPDSRPSISALQWVQYQLDNFSTIQEVIESDAHVRIVKTLSGPGLHYFVCDRDGNSAAIEFLDGKLIYYTNEKMPVKVLTNSTYEDGVRSWHHHQERRKSNYYAGARRFVRTAALLERYEANPSAEMIDRAFGILSAVSQGSFTKWNIVYDIRNLAIYFRTYSNRKIRQMALQDFDFSCQSPVLVLHINDHLSSDVTGRFIEYTRKDNRLLIENIFRSISVDDMMRKTILGKAVAYPEETICADQKYFSPSLLEMALQASFPASFLCRQGRCYLHRKVPPWGPLQTLQRRDSRRDHPR